jgi:hypothetical protein
MRHRPAIPVLLLALMASLSAQAEVVRLPPGVDLEEGLDADAVLQAVQRAEILPLDKVLQVLRAEREGEIVEIELDLDDGRVIYDFDVLSSGGRLYAVAVDAVTGRILEVEFEGEDGSHDDDDDD